MTWRRDYYDECNVKDQEPEAKDSPKNKYQMKKKYVLLYPTYTPLPKEKKTQINL
jgi:hypothetical protein